MASVERIHRMLRMVELLQSGRTYNSPQLAELLGVSRRTVFRDLSTLQEAGIHFIYDDAAQSYSLPAPVILPPTNFSVEESLSMLVLCHALGNEDTGIPFHRSARTAALKLLSNLPAHLREYVGEMTGLIAIRLDARNPLDTSKPHFDLLTESLDKRRKVRIRYRSLYDKSEITTLLSPYRLLFQGRGWYVIGRSSLHREVRTFNIGRILDSEFVSDHYKIPPRFSLERHLGNAWSLIRGRDREQKVVVRFQPKVAQNVAEVQWHRTQRIEWNEDGTLDFHVTVDGLSEIVWWILGYGDQAEVLKPAALRKEMKRHVTAMQATYARKPGR